MSQGPLALGMVLKDRLSFRPEKIRNLAGFKAILAKAKAVEKRLVAASRGELTCLRLLPRLLPRALRRRLRRLDPRRGPGPRHRPRASSTTGTAAARPSTSASAAPAPTRSSAATSRSPRRSSPAKNGGDEGRPRRPLQRLLPEPAQGRALHRAATPTSPTRSTRPSPRAACTTRRARSRSATSLEVLVDRLGFEAIRGKVQRPLRRPAHRPLLRLPPHPAADPRPLLDEAEYPTVLDELLRALGAEVVDFPLKTHCCGGHMTQISADTAYALIHRLIENAAEYRADVIADGVPDVPAQPRRLPGRQVNRASAPTSRCRSSTSRSSWASPSASRPGPSGSGGSSSRREGARQDRRRAPARARAGAGEGRARRRATRPCPCRGRRPRAGA